MSIYDPVTYWRERGRTYEARFRQTPEFARQEAALRSLLGRLQFDSVLEVGCGFGRIAALIRSIRPDASYTGIDVSPDMLASARAKLPDATFLESSLADFAAREPGRFDLVISVEFLMHQPPDEVGASIRALKRLARRHLVTLDWEAPGQTAGTYCFGYDYAAFLRGAERLAVGRQALWHLDFAS